MGPRGTRSHVGAALTREALVAAALAEDLGDRGDITSEVILPHDLVGAAALRARAAGVLAGRGVAQETADQLGLVVDWHADDGDAIAPRNTLAEFRGPARALLTAERTVLNFVCHLSGIATLTARFVSAAAPAAILDTRKTTPGWRALEKEAVRAGGGTNHRHGLHDRVLIKDNHLALAGARLADAVAAARSRYPDVLIEIEADDLAGVTSALAVEADWILLDNMDDADLRAAVALVANRARLEASGGVTLERVGAIAATGVDAISVGALTHSAPALDLAFDIDL